MDPAKNYFQFLENKNGSRERGQCLSLVIVQVARRMAEESIIWMKMQHKVI